MINKTLAAILVSFLIISGGVIYSLSPTGNKLSCTKGWVLEDSGKFEGQYSCQLAKSKKYSFCMELKDTAKVKGYWCIEAKATKINQTKEVICPKIIACTETCREVCR
jgi:hypothetical protein